MNSMNKKLRTLFFFFVNISLRHLRGIVFVSFRNRKKVTSKNFFVDFIQDIYIFFFYNAFYINCNMSTVHYTIGILGVLLK